MKAVVMRAPGDVEVRVVKWEAFISHDLEDYDGWQPPCARRVLKRDAAT